MEVGIGNCFLFFYFTLATANICNVVLMRNHELFTGIEVKDRNGNVVGTSKIAAQKVSPKKKMST